MSQRALSPYVLVLRFVPVRTQYRSTVCTVEPVFIRALYKLFVQYEYEYRYIQYVCPIVFISTGTVQVRVLYLYLYCTTVTLVYL